MGISRGGRTSKIHARVDARGRPLQIEVTGGEVHDIGAADILLQDISTDAVIADKAYDSNDIVHLKIKHYRGIATRYEKTIESFLGVTYLACIRLWLQ